MEDMTTIYEALPGQTRYWTEADCRAAIRDLYAAMGTTSTAAYRLHATGRPLPSEGTIVARFGGWSKAVRSAGLEPSTRPGRTDGPRYSDQAIVDALRACASDLGRVPSARGYDSWRAGRSGVPSYTLVIKRLGGWRSGLSAAGLIIL